MLKKLLSRYWQQRVFKAVVWLGGNVWTEQTDYAINDELLVHFEIVDREKIVKVLLCGKPVYELEVGSVLEWHYTRVDRFNYGSWVGVIWGIYQEELQAKKHAEKIARTARFTPLDE